MSSEEVMKATAEIVSAMVTAGMTSNKSAVIDAINDVKRALLR